MGINLQNALEPLIARLRELAGKRFTETQIPDEDVLRMQDLAASRGGDPHEVYVQEILKPELDDLVTRFQRYYVLDEYDLEAVAYQFVDPSDRWETPTGGSVYCNIARASADVDKVKLLVNSNQWTGKLVQTDEFTGQAALKFYTKFLKPFEGTAAVHAECAREMAIAAKALAEAIELVKESVVWICKKLIWILGEGDDPGLPPGEGGESGEGESRVKKFGAWGAILADAVTLFKLVTAPEHELLDIGLATIGVSGGLVAESKFSDVPQDTINFLWVGTVRAALWGAGDALAALDRKCAAIDDSINRGFDDDFAPSGLLVNSHATIDDPELTSDAYKKATFNKLNDPTVMDQVVVNVVSLYYAGYVVLPGAAAKYDSGVAVCAGADISGVRNQFPRSAAKFDEAASTFGNLLKRLRDEITRSGQSMVTAARTYETADADEAQAIQQYENIIPAPDDRLGQDHFYPPAWLLA
jgi:hypothetical protein